MALYFRISHFRMSYLIMSHFIRSYLIISDFMMTYRAGLDFGKMYGFFPFCLFNTVVYNIVFWTVEFNEVAC